MTEKEKAVDSLDKLTLTQLLLSVFSTKYYFKYIKPSFPSAKEAYSFAKKLRKDNLHYTSRMHISLISVIIVMYVSGIIGFIPFVFMFSFVDIVIIKTLNNTSDFVLHETKKKPVSWVEERVIPTDMKKSVKNTC